MLKSRHRAREIALQILYQYDLSGAFMEPKQKLPIPLEASAREKVSSLDVYFQHFHVSKALQPFVAELITGTLQHLKDIDQDLEKHIANWKMSRVSAVDRSLLRMAVFEMLYLKQTPHAIVMNESIELAKQFGTAETSAFINGILNSLSHPV